MKIKINKILDLRKLNCPLPILKIKKLLFLKKNNKIIKIINNNNNLLKKIKKILNKTKKKIHLKYFINKKEYIFLLKDK